MQKIVYTKQLQERLQTFRNQGKSVGFVPTMGALHQGHIALVEKALLENEIVVVSIFVNPTQFNNPDDLVNYPRTIENDILLLENAGCTILFCPDVKEIYPDGLVEKQKEINLGGLDLVMEGAHRPGHFAGVIQVVNKLFDAVGICKAYFGEKDFQQLAVIRKMVSEWHLPIEIIGCPIVREADGLAMSSRNVRLTKEERKIAPIISKTLFRAKEIWQEKSVDEIKEMVSREISNAAVNLSIDAQLKLEYFEIADINNLQPVEKNQKVNVVGCIAVQLGKVRLIDNIILG